MTAVDGRAGRSSRRRTALLVVNWSAISDATGFLAALPWFLPTVIGSALVAWVSAQVAQGKRPRQWARSPGGRTISSEQPARP